MWEITTIKKAEATHRVASIILWKNFMLECFLQV